MIREMIRNQLDRTSIEAKEVAALAGLSESRFCEFLASDKVNAGNLQVHLIEQIMLVLDLDVVGRDDRRGTIRR